MAWTRLYSEGEPQRINRWLAQSGVCSRREAEALIGQGLVSIDGERVDDPGRKIIAGQTLTLSDLAQDQLSATLSVLVHKPVGVVSAHPEPGQTAAIHLLTADNAWGDYEVLPDENSGLAPVGRLDMDSRGLLLLSADGVVAKAVIGPNSDLEKHYRVQVAGLLNDRKLKMLRHGMQLDGRQLRPARVQVIGDQVLKITLKEGRNRQIRRMCEMIDLEVIDLLRTRIGPIELADLPQGRWRPLLPAERQLLVGQPAGLAAGSRSA